MQWVGLIFIGIGVYSIFYWLKIYKNPDTYRTHIGPWGESLYAGGSKKERRKTAKWIAFCSMLGGLFSIAIGSYLLFFEI